MRAETKVKANRKTKLAGIIILFIVAAGIVLFFTTRSDKSTYVKYIDFNRALQNNEIQSAVIQSDTVEFKKYGDSEVYRTDNPQYEGFREKLLLSGVDVTTSDSAEDIFAVVFNVLYYVIFFGMIIFLIYRVADSYSTSFKVIKHTDISFEDIAGMDKLKLEMMRTVDIFKRPEEYRKKGIRPVKGMILEGPPGNGKTLFAKALANEAGVNFIATRGADFQSAFMSLGAKKLKMLFDKAYRKKPCIIFIDEFDGIGERRNYDGTGIDKENNRIITTMLNEMDGFADKDGILVIAATNSYSSLDEALIRPGRFDLKYHISNPDRKTREELVRLYTQEKKLADDALVERLAELFSGLSCSAIEAIINEASVASLSEDKTERNVIDMQCIISACERMGIRINYER